MNQENKKKLHSKLQLLSKHYQIENTELITFKKRKILLELLKQKNEFAYNLINNLIDAYLKLERIESDVEKKSKNTKHWLTEKNSSELEKEKAEQNLMLFCVENNIVKFTSEF